MLIAAVVLAIAGGGAVAWQLTSPSGRTAATAAAKAAETPAAGDTLTFAAADFADGKAHHYSHQTPDGLTVRFFVVKSSDGVIRAAFDACDVCWRAGLGYTQSGDDMVCNNCGRHFASVQVNEVQGGCNPAPLTRTLAGDRVTIKVSDVLEGRRYFNL
ncbi:MAG: DUF2318 domain-containing protein [Deltaproteobacteria bacterium]|nr:DUF2318 domain-containing protein [Deltaproteobacteria bacterium]